jgi:hypothetical protein
MSEKANETGGSGRVGYNHDGRFLKGAAAGASSCNRHGSFPGTPDAGQHESGHDGQAGIDQEPERNPRGGGAKPKPGPQETEPEEEDGQQRTKGVD